MFKAIQFKCQPKGVFTGDGGVTFTARDLHSVSFRLENSYRGLWPILEILRVPKTDGSARHVTDPWVIAGSPEKLVTTVLCPTIIHERHWILVTGFEMPGLVWAGFARPEFTGCPRPKIAKKYLWTDELGKAPDDLSSAQKQMLRLEV